MFRSRWQNSKDVDNDLKSLSIARYIFEHTLTNLLLLLIASPSDLEDAQKLIYTLLEVISIVFIEELSLILLLVKSG